MECLPFNKLFQHDQDFNKSDKVAHCLVNNCFLKSYSVMGEKNNKT
jgi:hypothetical protein